MTALLHIPAVRGAIAGVLASAGTDYHAFLTWKKFQDAESYDWNTAVFRWIQGAVTGAIAGAGLGAWS